jgi:hypothetical protein
MTANINIVTEKKDNILLLPSSAISSENNKYYVQKVQNNQTKKVEIQT